MAEGPDIGMQMAQWAARMQSAGGGDGKQGPLDKPINQGAAQVTSAHGGGGLKLVGAFGGTGRGMFGSAGDKWSGLLSKIFDDIKGMSFPVQQASISDITGASHGLGGGASPSQGGGMDLG